jgi:hypothetical protein
VGGALTERLGPRTLTVTGMLVTAAALPALVALAGTAATLAALRGPPSLRPVSPASHRHAARQTSRPLPTRAVGCIGTNLSRHAVQVGSGCWRWWVSYILMATTRPEAAVSAATVQIAAATPARSAMTPASSAPMAKPASRHSR